MPTILLIRHGQASFGTDDYDRLSQTGIQQAEVTALALAQRGVVPSVVISGSLKRQIDTAAPSAFTFGVIPAVDPRWNEYEMDEIIAAHHDPQSGPVSSASGISSAAFQEILETCLERWMESGVAMTAPDSWPAFNARIQAGLRDLADSLKPSTTALVFTSGGVIATVCAGLLGLPAHPLVLLNRVSVNAAITKLTVGRRGLSLIAFNDHSHLEGTGLITYR